DPSVGYLPVTGTLEAFAPASGPGVRWDTGVTEGDLISVHYDPMLAKVVGHGPTRAEAAASLARALDDTVVLGATTNRDLLVDVLRDPTFLSGDTTTAYLEERYPDDGARRFRPTPAAEWLVLLAEQSPKSNQRTRVDVLADGELIAQWEVPPFTSDPLQRQPLVVSLAPFHTASDEPVRLEIVQSPTNEESPVIWRTAVISDRSPTLLRLLDDEGEFRVADGAEETSIAWDTSNRHSGERAVQIQSPGRYTLALPQEAAIRERPGLSEYRFIRFAFRKGGKGRVAVELERREEGAPPIRYDAGLGEPSYGSAARVWSLELPNEWIVMTRDLYKEFGKADVRALTLSVPDGEQAWFDHIYLARTEKDLEAIPATRSPDAVNQEARRELAKNVLDRIVPATVAIDYDDGRFSTGVLVSREGDVLTAGHAVVGPGKDATVLLRDGRRLKAKTLGVARDLDLGLVRIEEKEEWPVIELGDARNLSSDQLYLGAAHRERVESQEAPAAHIVGIQRVLDGVIWTDFALDDWSSGGPLVDRDARLVGVHRGESYFGGFRFTQLVDIHNTLAKMRNGEVWGEWPAGSGPMMGVHVESVPGGCRVTEVYSETPAVEAGVQKGDRVVKIGGQPVRHLDDIYAALADRNAGQSVALELRRGSETVSANVGLIPRTP
ncbi:MAG: PDZ domain-containing protein, partial [Planctomycetes bacterium]|nr:PDZ domain-containing protein [Planctomycetota bacterium]